MLAGVVPVRGALSIGAERVYHYPITIWGCSGTDVWVMRMTVAHGDSFCRIGKDWVGNWVFVQWEGVFGGAKLKP